MDRGAREMRARGQRLQDPAYRAEVVARQAARGNPVTDADLLALAERLPERAEALERRAAELRARSRQD